uniref:Uncharacterized protein n=1 Tax=Setaria viridis TaxID=4556 RepID=A0A4U6TCN2_SETVI|nr:hypothetical protein SEVIR_9G565400v2 [Setaria viridis]
MPPPVPARRQGRKSVISAVILIDLRSNVIAHGCGKGEKPGQASFLTLASLCKPQWLLPDFCVEAVFIATVWYSLSISMKPVHKLCQMAPNTSRPRCYLPFFTPGRDAGVFSQSSVGRNQETLSVSLVKTALRISTGR